MLNGVIADGPDGQKGGSGIPGLQSMDTKILKDQVVQLLRSIILSGKISAGGRINESQLARDLGVSRIPIREALQQLEQQGLVVTIPRRGKFVISLTDEEIQKINGIRLILEAESLRLCRAKINSAGIDALQRVVKKMEKSGKVSEIEAAAMELEFHGTIWRYSGNDLLAKTLEGITIPLFAHRALWRMKREMHGWASILPSHHRLLLEFVLGKVQDSAEQVMLSHLSYRYPHPERFSSLALEPQHKPGGIAERNPGEERSGRQQPRSRSNSRLLATSSDKRDSTYQLNPRSPASR